MKTLKTLLAACCAMAILAGPAANLYAHCGSCPGDKKEGKECAKKCCEEAKKAGKTCDKCAKKEGDKK